MGRLPKVSHRQPHDSRVSIMFGQVHQRLSYVTGRRLIVTAFAADASWQMELVSLFPVSSV